MCARVVAYLLKTYGTADLVWQVPQLKQGSGEHLAADAEYVLINIALG